MTIAEQIYEQARTLPDAVAAEVLDFIGYLRMKMNRPPAREAEAAPSRVTQGSTAISGSNPPVLYRKPPSEEEVEEILQKTCGAWGPRTLEETEELIRQRRIADWGEDEEIQAAEDTEVSFTGPLANLRSRVIRKHGNAQPLSRDELYDRNGLR
ncbi:MAG: hypothetical protein HQL56_15225 [Magnetococcales bacterium]|nr:hypothetical protein [Magnetococcales bacterium]